ncbi:PsiF family protein [Dokdonella sp. MW10]|uniref:PsiF family protein n=1 Tax=Dokdonella sp. MW10 TaxID=2992926 RepID=UPI003F81C7F9
MILRTTIAFALTLGLAAMPLHAAEKAPTTQQQRMTDCNQQATGKTGDERKTFMSACLKGETPAQTQQDKMKTCNASATAKELKGEARKAYMSSCLSAKPAATS